jgi:hypothetical protein
MSAFEQSQIDSKQFPTLASLIRAGQTIARHHCILKMKSCRCIIHNGERHYDTGCCRANENKKA